MADSIEILVVDDDAEIADLVEIYLCSADYIVHKATNARDGLALIDKYDIKLAILDIMMPIMDGIEMCKRIRSKKNIPIIMLSAKSADLDKIVGLSAGADDYITKPFNPLELTARVKSQLRRYMELNPNVQQTDKNIINIKDITIDVSKHKVHVGDREVSLTPIEFDILKLLAKHPGRVFSTDEIFEKVWNEKIYEAIIPSGTYKTSSGKKSSGRPENPKDYSYVWGVGYKIES